ncbi:MAG TPA: hypothetical protein VH394_18670 [Thermoanaerobaculia bacterium]|jgi:hypothetical protein|nr:hypothetical protein [Thermoanaerobaculia bacterium]
MERSNLRRRIAVAVLLLAAYGFWAPQPATAAGCHTGCGNEQPPNCLGCTFLAFSQIMCLRLACNFCQEDYCWTGLPAGGDQMTASGPAAAPKTPESKVLRVEVLSPRT